MRRISVIAHPRHAWRPLVAAGLVAAPQPAETTTLVVLVSRRAIVIGADSMRTLASGGTESVCKIHARDGVVYGFAGAVSSARFDATAIAARELVGGGALGEKARRIADALQAGLVEHFRTHRIARPASCRRSAAPGHRFHAACRRQAPWLPLCPRRSCRDDTSPDHQGRTARHLVRPPISQRPHRGYPRATDMRAMSSPIPALGQGAALVHWNFGWRSRPARPAGPPAISIAGSTARLPSNIAASAPTGAPCQRARRPPADHSRRRRGAVSESNGARKLRGEPRRPRGALAARGGPGRGHNRTADPGDFSRVLYH